MSLVTRILDLFASLFSAEKAVQDVEETSRIVAKDAVKGRIEGGDAPTGTIIDYSLRSEGDRFTSPDWKIVFDVDVGEFGTTNLVFDLPEPFENRPRLGKFLTAVGAETVEDLDAALGEEFAVSFDPNGMVHVEWNTEGSITDWGLDTSGDQGGAVYVNENTVDDPEIIDPGEMTADGVSSVDE